MTNKPLTTLTAKDRAVLISDYIDECHHPAGTTLADFIEDQFKQAEREAREEVLKTWKPSADITPLVDAAYSSGYKEGFKSGATVPGEGKEI